MAYGTQQIRSRGAEIGFVPRKVVSTLGAVSARAHFLQKDVIHPSYSQFPIKKNGAQKYGCEYGAFSLNGNFGTCVFFTVFTGSRMKARSVPAWPAVIVPRSIPNWASCIACSFVFPADVSLIR